MNSTDPADASVSPPTNSPERFRAIEQMLAQWRSGDADALDRLLAQIHPMLYRWALANATNVDDADDIAQHALIAVYRKIHQFRGDASLAAWMYRLTTRIALQRQRKRARRKVLDTYVRAEVADRVYTTDPGGRVDRDRLTAFVRECYDQLPPQQRAAITLVDFEGYSPADAAVLMDLSPVTLRANLFKARASIRRRVLALEPALAERFAHLPEPVTGELKGTNTPDGREIPR